MNNNKGPVKLTVTCKRPANPTPSGTESYPRKQWRDRVLAQRGNALTEPQTERTDHKSLIVLNKKIEPANALNACAHMTATHDLYRYEL